MISRDGAQIYANASEKSHPGVVQVSDRFHMIKGLTEAMTKYIIREFPTRLEIPAVSTNSEEHVKLIDQRNHVDRVRFAQTKKAEGMTVNEIALLLHSSVKTIQKYLAKIYTAQGKSIEEALYKAEQQQNKKPFYAQNEILLLGPGAARNVTPYLSYFADENAARPNLAAFLTPLTAEELSECEDVISDVVREGERLIGMGADEQDRTQSIFEINLSGTGGLDGYLPVFSFSKEAA